MPKVFTEVLPHQFKSSLLINQILWYCACVIVPDLNNTSSIFIASDAYPRCTD